LPASQLDAFSERLRMHIMPQNDRIVISLFFLEHVLPHLGSGPAWMYILLRDRCYEGADEQRDLCKVQGGYAEISSWLGISRPRTVYEWFYGRGNKKAKEPGKLRFPVTSVYITVLDLGKATSFAKGARTFRILLNDVPAEIVQAVLESDDDHYADFSIVFTQFSEDLYASFSIVFTQFADDLYASFRVFKLFNSLNNSKTLLKPSPLIPPQEKKKASLKEKAGVGSMTYWDLEYLLTVNGVNAGKRNKLRKAGAQGETFAAWLIHAYSPAGAGLRDTSGVSNAIARTLESPRGGPGGVVPVLAKLPPHRLKAILEKDLDGEDVENTAYQAALGNQSASGKAALLIQLFGDQS